MTLLEKINSLTWYDLINKLKDILKELVGQDGGDSRPYKVYTALLSQSDTDAPVATVLENTFNVNFSFEYIHTGIYKLSSSTNVFVANKTCFFADIVRDLGTYSTSEVLVTYDEITPNYINIHTVDTSDGVHTTANSVLNNTTIEIRVYN